MTFQCPSTIRACQMNCVTSVGSSFELHCWEIFVISFLLQLKYVGYLYKYIIYSRVMQRFDLTLYELKLAQRSYG
jgi:hypothetical protein